MEERTSDENLENSLRRQKRGKEDTDSHTEMRTALGTQHCMEDTCAENKQKSCKDQGAVEAGQSPPVGS